MGILNSNKTVDSSSINCDGTLNVTLALTAAPDIASNPTDIVLVLDRSGSMEGDALANLKLGANTFIDIIDESTDGSQDGQIGSGSHIGIVSFATNATQDTQLITSVADLKQAVDNLTAEGFTNHADAFTEAIDLFDPQSTNAKVIVMFTDGNTTIGADPSPVAASARAQGIVIYCLGLIGSDGVDVSALNDWATDPDTSHVAVTPDASDLEELFEDLAANISKPGATNINIDEVLNSDFQITNIGTPTKGDATLVDARSLNWTIDELGVTGNEGASLTFTIRHVGTVGGTKAVNELVTYTDNENNVVNFPSPEVSVDCEIIITPEDCPEPVDFTVEGCEDTIEYDLGVFSLNALGRMVNLSLNIRNVCPNKRVALAVELFELDENQIEHKRGLKMFTIPEHTSDTCRDVLVQCIRFVLPEDLNTTCTRMCRTRNLRAKVFCNYIDNDFTCCPDDTSTNA